MRMSSPKTFQTSKRVINESAKIGDQQSERLDTQESYEDDSYYDEEDEIERYVNPYLYIPSIFLGCLFLLLLPYFDFINIRFLSRNTRLGTARFDYRASCKDYYLIYLIWFAGALVLISLWWLEIRYDLFDDWGLWWVLIVITLLSIPATRSYFKSRRYNLLLNNTVIDGKHHLGANTTFLWLFWLMLSNTVLVILSFGFMKPWAQIRTANYILTSSSLSAGGSLDDFVAAQKESSSALAEEIADVFDLDILG